MWTWLVQHPLLLGFVVFAVVAMCSRTWMRQRRDARRGWRLRTDGFDAYYEEWGDGRWQGLKFVNRPVPGRTRREIQLPSDIEWAAQPDWLRRRRAEIVSRIQEGYPSGRYDYSGEEASS